MSRVLREVDGKRPSRELIVRVAEVLELLKGYFVEQRRSRIVSLLETDPGLIDRLGAVSREPRTRRPTGTPRRRCCDAL